jgi:arsenate reductase-like glutaredoxin family protein
VNRFQHADTERPGAKEALSLARSATRVVVAKGKKVWTFDMAEDQPNEATLQARLLDSTGNLRTPTIQKRHTLLVGFNEDVYRRYLRG